MRLITHNMLKSNIKGVEKGFPLRIEVDKTEERELEFNAGAVLCRKKQALRHTLVVLNGVDFALINRERVSETLQSGTVAV